MDVLIRALAVWDGDEVLYGLGAVKVDLTVDAGCLLQGGTQGGDVDPADAARFAALNFSAWRGNVRKCWHKGSVVSDE